MSADTTTSPTDSDRERFVEIPRARPGQEYKPPKNFPSPLMDGVYRIVVMLMCLGLIAAPAVIVFMILIYSQAIAHGLLWLWIVMIILTETIALGVSWGLAREALGSSGVSYSSPRG
jgi:hypothetical protein